MNKQLEQYASIVWEPEDLIEIRPLQTWQGKRVWSKAGDLHMHFERMAAENERGANIFAGILPRDRDGGGKAEDVSGGRVLWADFDHCEPGDVDDIIHRLKLPYPTMVVDSGHGAHVFWRLKEWTDKATIQKLVSDLIAFLLDKPESQNYIDKSAKDPARILRLPGYVNHKKPAKAATILYSKPEKRYTPSDFAMLTTCELPKREPVRVPTGSPTDATERARRYIAMIPGTGPGGRTTTAFKVAATLSNDFELSDSEALQMLQGWDQSSNTPTIESDYGPDELGKILQNSKKYKSKPPGTKNSLPPKNSSEIEGVDISGILSMGGPKPENDDFPMEFYNVPGLIGDVIAHNMESAPKPQPVLALAGAISLQAVLCARKLTDEAGTRPNLYICGVAESGAGKDHARQLNKRILFESGFSKLQAEGIKSGSGLINALVTEPALLFQLDEFGRFIQTANSTTKNPHIADIITKLLGLYSSSHSIYESDRYADKDAGGKQIHTPHAILYGTTVPRSLYEGLTEESVTDGFLSRTLIFDVESNNPKRRRMKSMALPEAIVERAKWWGEYQPPGSGNLNPEAHTAPITAEANDIAERFVDLEHNEQAGLASSPLKTLWTRTAQNADKLALIYAASKDPESPIVDAEAARWGYNLAEWLTRRMVRVIGDNVADNQHHAEVLKVRRFAKAAGGSITRAKLMRRMKITAADMDKIVHYMVETGELAIKAEEQGNKGRPITTYALLL